MIRRFVFVLGALLLAGVGFGLPAHAGYTPDDAAISVSPSSVAAGGTATVSGTGCAADVDVTITLGDTEAATATTDDDGAFSASITVPTGAAPGPYTIEADGCSATVLSTTLTVTAAGTGCAAAIDAERFVAANPLLYGIEEEDSQSYMNLMAAAVRKSEEMPKKDPTVIFRMPTTPGTPEKQ